MKIKHIAILASIAVFGAAVNADTFKTKTGATLEILQKDGKLLKIEPTTSEPVAMTKWFTSITFKFAVNGPNGDALVSSPIAINFGGHNPSKMETINLIKMEAEGNKRLYCLKATASDVVPCAENEVIPLKARKFPERAENGAFSFALPENLAAGEYGLHVGGEVWTFSVKQ
jgi:hypothetical protein